MSALQVSPSSSLNNFTKRLSRRPKIIWEIGLEKSVPLGSSTTLLEGTVQVSLLMITVTTIKVQDHVRVAVCAYLSCCTGGAAAYFALAQKPEIGDGK